MVEPIGWSSMRSSLHYRSVFPSLPEVGMQVNLHKNLSKRLHPKEIIVINQNNIDVARKILHRQRVALRLFSGSRLNLKGSTPHETSARLHRQPPPTRDSSMLDIGRENSDIHSYARSEGSQMLTEASVYGGGPLPPLHLTAQGRGATMSPIPASAMSQYPDTARSVTERLASFDPEKVPESRGYMVKLEKPIVYKKKYTEPEVQAIVRRLTEYDSSLRPPESKGVRSNVSVVTSVPRQSMTRIKKCSAQEVQDIVERLYKFDAAKWPPESKARPVIHSGRPTSRPTTKGTDAGTLTSVPPPPPPTAPSIAPIENEQESGSVEADEHMKNDEHAEMQNADDQSRTVNL